MDAESPSPEENVQKERRPRLSLSQRRNSGGNLEKLQIPPLDSSQQVIAMSGVQGEFMDGEAEDIQVVEEGKDLFNNFLSSEMHKVHLPNGDIPLQPSPGYRNPEWAQAGRHLRQMADEFAKTEGRNQVYRQALQLPIDNVTFGQFRELLTEIFSQARGGVTYERIVVLFFFCSDVSILALQAGYNMFSRFVDWSLRFIARDICTWVSQHGGWGRVLSQPFNSFKKLFVWMGTAAAVVLLINFIRRKSLK